MKKTTLISILLTAATALLCLCGVFFCSPHSEESAPVSETQDKHNPAAQFSLDSAKAYLGLCSASYYPESLEAKLKEADYGDFQYFLLPQENMHDNGIAFGVAHSSEGIIAVFRGTDKQEWYSNFNIGTDSEHRGFSYAADFACDKIREYAGNHLSSTEGSDIVITGHSRGGAVANLVAARLIDRGDFPSVTAYTFASPNTTTSASAGDDKYHGIFNIINPEDFICYIPLESWGYTKYGINLEFPLNKSDSPALYEKMEEEFKNITGTTHIGYPNGHGDVEKFLLAAEEIAPTVSDYYNREITLHPHRVTLYEYMNKAAALLSGSSPISNGMFLVTGSNSPQLKEMTDFIMQGIDIEEIAKTQDISSSAIASAHTYETYHAWMNVLLEKYFTDIAHSN